MAMRSLESFGGVEGAASGGASCASRLEISLACQAFISQLAGYTTPPPSVKIISRHGMLAKEGCGRGGTRARREMRVAVGVWLWNVGGVVRVGNLRRERRREDERGKPGNNPQTSGQISIRLFW